MTMTLLGVLDSFSAWFVAMNVLSVSGLMWDIAGAAILARGLFAATPRTMLLQASSGYGGFNSRLLWMFHEQKTDARFGVSLFIIGFVLQLVAALDSRMILQPAGLWLVILLGPLALILVAYFAWRERLIKRGFRAALLLFRTMHPAVSFDPEEIYAATVEAMRSARRA